MLNINVLNVDTFAVPLKGYQICIFGVIKRIER